MPKTETPLIALSAGNNEYTIWRQLPGGRKVTVLDGKTFKPVRVPKIAVLNMNNGAVRGNLAYRLAAMLMED